MVIFKCPYCRTEYEMTTAYLSFKQRSYAKCSFFRHRLANDWVGRFLSVLTLTPYDDWRRAHAIHHANSGHLDRRGIGDIDTLTVREFQALAFWGRLRYRLYRHPLVGVHPV